MSNPDEPEKPRGIMIVMGACSIGKGAHFAAMHAKAQTMQRESTPTLSTLCTWDEYEATRTEVELFKPVFIPQEEFTGEPRGVIPNSEKKSKKRKSKHRR